MRIIEETQLDFSDILISPKRSTLNSRSEVNLFRDFEWIGGTGEKQHLNSIPIICANMATIATPKIAKRLAIRGFMCALEKHLSLSELQTVYDDLINLAKNENIDINSYTQRIMPSIGVKEAIDDIVKLSKSYKIHAICVDVPNGYISKLIDRIKELHAAIPNALIIAGNVVTPDISQDIILAGGMCAKVGIGPGSVCLTRKKTGVGRPQASAVIDCADACHQINGFCCSDGGCTSPGDIVKAFGCGADFVMIGGMFAGCEEAEGEVVYIDNKPHKLFYGMSSNLAQDKHFGGRHVGSTSEGREKFIPIVGTLNDIVNDIEGGIKSAMCYIGAKKIKNISKNCTFYKVNHQLNSVFANCKEYNH